jgi:Flp pilus assembly protein TadG
MNKRSRRRQRPDARGQSGSTLVLVTVFATALFGFAALSIDISRVYKEGRHEQFATDAAAYAGVVRLTNTLSSAAKTAAIQEASDVAGANGVTSSELSNGGGVQVGQWTNSTFTADATPYNAVRVPSKRTVGMTFARVVGLGSMSPKAHSIADLESAGRVANAIPVGLSLAVLTNETFGSQMTLHDSSFGPGKWAKIDLGNYQNTGAWQADMTTNGCNCEVSVGTIPTIQGAAQVQQSFNALGAGAIFAMPVVDDVSFSGGSGQANILGFVVVELLSSSGTGANWTATVQFLAQVTGDRGGGGCPPPCVQARFLVQ